MEETYDLHQHTFCVLIYIAKTKIHTRVIDNSNRNISIACLGNVITQDACITYNKQRTQVLNCGDRDFDQGNQDHTRIDNFMSGLYAVFEKEKCMRDIEDRFLMQAISDFLDHTVKEIMEDPDEFKIETPDELHFVFIVPSEWPEGIRLELIRPMFVKANIISEDDHQDRLLFLTNVESLFYHLEKVGYFSFERGQNTILTRLTAIEPNKVLVKLDLAQTMNDLFDFDGSMLFPRIMRSDSFTVTSEYIKNSIRGFLKNKLDPMPHDLAMEAMVEGLFNSELPSMDAYDLDGELYMPWFVSEINWAINKSQEEFIKSLRPFEICDTFESTFIDNFRNVISNNFIKKYILLFVDQFYSSCTAESALINWIKCILDYSRRDLNSNTSIGIADTPELQIDPDKVLGGANIYVTSAIQNSDIYSMPRILPMEANATSTSIFLNSKPDVIVNIDISLESTLLSCSVLNEDGLVKKILEHSYFTTDKCLPSLGSFYQFSDVITLNVNEQFITFSEKYFINDFDDKDQIENILNNLTPETMISTKQQKYIKAFFKMYMVYIQQIISAKLHFNNKIKIGYAVSTEKKIPRDIIGTEKDFEELIFATNLVCKNNDCNKLRVVTQGDVMLPVIQKYFGLKFRIKSYFILSQVHQDYIQLTLNQIVTKDEKEQESVIFKDEIIPITNIYESLCLYMWEDFTKDSSLLQLCDIHCESDKNFLELFSLESQNNFMEGLKHYISNYLLAENADWETRNKNIIQLNHSCECKVCFTSKDVIEISFKPFLQQTVSIISNSLGNQEIFGKYRNIDYIFTTVNFNFNSQLQDILVQILNEQFEDYNEMRGIDATCLVMPEPSKFLHPILMQRPLSYTAFQLGTLRQIYSENYSFTISLDDDEETYSYKKKISDQAIEVSTYHLFASIEKGNRAGDDAIKNMFYLNLKKDFEDRISIFYRKVKPSDTNEDKSLVAKNSSTGFCLIFPKPGTFSQGSDIPILVSATFEGYSSSLQFSAKLVGEYDKKSKMAEPMTLYRF